MILQIDPPFPPTSTKRPLNWNSLGNDCVLFAKGPSAWLFMWECGSGTMTNLEAGLLITNVPRKEWYAPITTTPQILGRGSNTQIQIPPQHLSVSRAHAKVWTDQIGIWISDLKSTRGTRVNGLDIAPETDTRIMIGDRITLGKLEIVLIDSDDSSATISASSDSMEEQADTTSIKPVEADATNPEFDLTATLSKAERQLLLWISRGYTSPEEIGKFLKRSPHTIRTQLNSIFRKMGVHSRDELVGYLLRTK